MKVVGKINKKSVVILIDTSSIHNFEDTTMEARCKLSVQKGNPIQVKVANDEVLCNEGQI